MTGKGATNDGDKKLRRMKFEKLQFMEMHDLGERSAPKSAKEFHKLFLQ